MIEYTKVDKPSEEVIKEFMELVGDKRYDEAKEIIDNVLTEYPECAEAYLALVLIDLKLSSPDDLYIDNLPPMTNENFRRLVLFADGETREILDELLSWVENDTQKYGLEYRDYGDYYKFCGAKNECLYMVVPSNYNDKPVMKIGNNCFKDDKKIISVRLSSSIKEIENDAFFGCQSLECATLNEGLEIIGNRAFFGCSSLYEIHLPDTVSSIGESVFSNCDKLSDVTLPSFIDKIPPLMFLGCKSLKSIEIPESVKEIEKLSFAGCTSLSDIELPPYLEIIGEGAFLECVGIKNIIIPKSVKRIHHTAFEKCNNIVIYYEGSKDEFEKLIKEEDVEDKNRYLFGGEAVLCSEHKKEITVYFYSEKKKLFSNNLWHYLNGVATIW